MQSFIALVARRPKKRDIPHPSGKIDSVPMTRLALPFFAALLFVALMSSAARAENETKRKEKASVPRAQILVVLDRGTSAAQGATENLAKARALVHALTARGMRAKALAMTTTSENLARLRELKLVDKDLKALARNKDYAFKRPTGVGVALRVAKRRRGTSLAQWLILVGPFSTADVKDADDKKELVRGVTSWNKEVPKGTRVIGIGLSDDARAVLERDEGQAAGWHASGRFVFRVGEPKVSCEAPAPVDLTAETTEGTLRAEVAIPTESLPWGEHPPPLPLEIKTGRDADGIESTIDVTSETLSARITRDDVHATDITVRVEHTEEYDAERVVFFATLPEPVQASWPAPKRVCLLLDADGNEARSFRAEGVRVGKPARATYLIAYTDLGDDEPPPTWHVGNHLRRGVDVSFGAPRKLRPGVRVRSVTISFEPERGHGGVVKGFASLVTESGFEGTIKIPYECEAAAPKAKLVLQGANSPHRLPQGASPTRTAFTVRDENGMTPDTVHLSASITPDAWKSIVSLFLSDSEGRARPMAWDETLSIGRDTTYEVTARLLDPNTLPTLEGSAEISLRASCAADTPIEGELVLAIGKRVPRLVVRTDTTTYHVDQQTLKGTHAIRLELDADGVTGDALLRLMESSPTVEATPPEPQAWSLRLLSPGKWQLEPTGRWKGAKQDSFSSRREEVSFSFRWRDFALKARAKATVVTPAKVKPTKWPFLGLGALAALLGFLTVLQFRPPPIKGTLLYTVDGVDRAVGRLSLDAIGRRKAKLHATKRGKLSIGGSGDPVATIQPTRVGPMIVSRSESGEKSRRLLVDGLALRTGRHTIRYVSGAPDEEEATTRMADIPDLFGDDFDIETGKVDEAWRAAKRAQAGSGLDVDADEE